MAKTTEAEQHRLDRERHMDCDNENCCVKAWNEDYPDDQISQVEHWQHLNLREVRPPRGQGGG